MPQIQVREFFPLSFWLLINFAVIFAFFYIYFLPLLMLTIKLRAKKSKLIVFLLLLFKTNSVLFSKLNFELYIKSTNQ